MNSHKEEDVVETAMSPELAGTKAATTNPSVKAMGVPQADNDNQPHAPKPVERDLTSDLYKALGYHPVSESQWWVP